MRSLCLRDTESRTLAETGECEIHRAVKPQPEYVAGTVWSWHFPKPDRYGVSGTTGCEEGLLIGLRDYCPLGQLGEQRWVRETWAQNWKEQTITRAEWDILYDMLSLPTTVSADTVDWRPAITMPRWASRFTVEVVSTDVFVRDGVWYWRARVRRVE